MRCIYTGVELTADDVVWVGATMPGVKARYPMAATAEAKALRKFEQVAFHESEANCNTCKHLERVAHPRHWSGFLYGKCEVGQLDVHPYANRIENGVIPIHPDDPMHMPCYESRWE